MIEFDLRPGEMIAINTPSGVVKVGARQVGLKARVDIDAPRHIIVDRSERSARKNGFTPMKNPC